MNRSILWALVTSVSAAALIACTTDNTFNLPGDDDGEGGQGNSVGDGASSSDGGGTVGDGGSTGNVNPTSAAHDYFITDVYPSISATCGACHGNSADTTGAPPFLAEAGAEASYTAITNYTPTLIAIPDNSNLVLHGAHTGPALTSTQVTMVSTWLEMEAEERGLVGGGENPPPTGPTLQEALQGFADCMDYNDWTAAGMQNLANTQTQYGSCNSCHASGEAGAWISLNDQQMFNMNREFPYIKRLVSGTVDETGNFAGLVAARRFQNKGLEAAGCNEQIDNCHPVFNLQAAKVQAIDTFVEETIAKYEAGGCAPQP